MVRGHMDKVTAVKEQIKWQFDKNTHSWQDYERAKSMIRDFDYQEYQELIKFIANHLGV